MKERKEAGMDRLLIGGSLGFLKGKLKRMFSNLTDEDLKYEEGHEQELLEHLQKKLGLTQREIISIFEKL